MDDVEKAKGCLDKVVYQPVNKKNVDALSKRDKALVLIDIAQGSCKGIIKRIFMI